MNGNYSGIVMNPLSNPIDGKMGQYTLMGFWYYTIAFPIVGFLKPMMCYTCCESKTHSCLDGNESNHTMVLVENPFSFPSDPILA